MKQIFFIFSMVMVSSATFAQRSQEAFTLTIKTSSEVRATNVLENLSTKIILTSEQKDELTDIIRYYLEEYQNIVQRENAEEALGKLTAYRDRTAKKILNNDSYFIEFVSVMEEVRRSQSIGYGRR